MKEEISQIYEKFSQPLLYFILKSVSNKHVAQDLLHEVFLKAYKNFDSLSEKEKVQSWLYKIASNTIIDYTRKKKLPTVNSEDNFFEQEVEETVLSELSCCLNTLVDQLPFNQKEVLKAVYFNEKTLIEYAKENDLNISTVKSYSKRAKEKFKIFF